MCSVTFSPNVNVALWWAERERDREVKRNLNVFVNHRENAVCASHGERERRWERRWQSESEWKRERERGGVCSCAIVTNSRLLFILACGSQQPPHIRCEIGGEEKGARGGGGGFGREGGGGGGGVEGFATASKHSSLKATNLRFQPYPPPPPWPS